ncbi:MAG: glycosyltransferase family 2 protein [Candidatus Binatia bacterium]
MTSEEKPTPDGLASARCDRPADALFSVVVPVFNEEACVAEMVSRIRDVFADVNGDYELIFVDDGSSDGTIDEIRKQAESDPHVKFVSFSRNFGHQFALTAGLDHAAGDAVITLDGDLQHPPELIPTLVEHWRAGKDVVYTVRTRNDGHFLKEAVSAAFYWTLRKLTGVDVPTGGADFRLLDRQAADALRQCREQFVFVRGLVPWIGFTRQSVPYAAHERFGGETKYLTRRMLSFALDGIFSFSIIPLRLISILGAITIGMGLLYGLYTVGVRLFSETAVTGWASLIVVILVFSGTQLLSLGILSEYVGRIYEEVKQRPRYVVGEKSPSLDRVGDPET